VAGQELSYAEVKAIASGNPAVLTLAETDAELQRLSAARKPSAFRLLDHCAAVSRGFVSAPSGQQRSGRRTEGG
jgi:hypothetical protein